MVEKSTESPQFKLNSVIFSLSNCVDFSSLKKTFDTKVLSAFEQGTQITVVLAPRIDINGVRLSKDAIQQKMYSEGYRRVKNDEIQALSSRYSMSPEHIEGFRGASHMFFTPVFPKKGEDNLVAINKIRRVEEVGEIEVETCNQLVMVIAAARKDIQDRVDTIVANAKNSAISKSAIDPIAFSDCKGMSNLVETVGYRPMAEMRRMLKLQHVDIFSL